MHRVRIARFVGLVAGALALAAVGTLAPTQPTAPPAPADVHQVSTTYPTNAAKIFRWGHAQWKDEFHGAMGSMWRVNRRTLVRNQHGMLTLEATAHSGSVMAIAVGRNRRYGRWEARVRGRQYGTSGTPYHVVWELVPMYGGYHCAARNLILSDYSLGTDLATMHVRNTPDADFTASKELSLSDNQFHTYAVEVTPDHISWFVDTRVVMTERRPEALSAAVFAPRFRLIGVAGAQMNRARMQMDWVRYYTLARKNARSIEAPQAAETTYPLAC